MNAQPAAPASPGARVIVALGLSQLITWGISFYLAGAFGPAIAADLGWSQARVYGGFSLAIVTMGLASPLAGRAIDRRGGRSVMSAGCVLIAIGCLLLAWAHEPVGFYAAWTVLGLGMRLSLYDAAFATLARIGGPASGRAMAQITLFGGLASTVFWPVGSALQAWLGWRGAVCCYAGFALLVLPLHAALPASRYTFQSAGAPGTDDGRGLARTDADRRRAGLLFAILAMLTNFLAAGNAAHLIAVLGGLGLDAKAAVATAALWGIGQVAARLAEVLFGRRLHPLTLAVVACAVLPCAFLAGLAAGVVPGAAVAFALCFGACNGLLTITRGTLPLALFDARTYGAFTGRLLAPSFLLMAAAPPFFALILQEAGALAMLAVSLALAMTMLAAAVALRRRFLPAQATRPAQRG